MRRIALFTLAGLTALAASAFGWTAPVLVSDVGTNYGLDPRLAPGFGGRLYVTWHQQGWGVYFRERSAGGTWSGIARLRSASTWSAETGVTEDGQYRPHVVYLEEDAGKNRTLVHRHRDQGAWSRTVLSTGTEESVPCVDTDGAGRVHLVYAKGSDNQHRLYHRIWTDGPGWSADTLIGSGAIESGRVGYHRPDIQARGSAVHMAWIEPAGARYAIRYKRYNGGNWSATKTLGLGLDGKWVASCRIAVADDNTVVAAWHRDTGLGYSRIFYADSADSGETWSAEQQLPGNDVTPSNMYGRGGKAYLVTLANPAVRLYTWSNGAWNSGERVNSGEVNFNGWGDVTRTVDGAVHLVYYHAVNSGNTSGGVDYVVQAPSTFSSAVAGRVVDAVGPVPGATVTTSLGGETASGPDGRFTLACPDGAALVRLSKLGYDDTTVSNVELLAGQTTDLGDIVLTGRPPLLPPVDLVVTPGNTRVDLAWRNSSSVNFARTLIVFRDDRYPTGPTDGTLLVDQPGYPGEPDGCAHTGLTNGVRLYYAVYAHDDHPVRTYAAPLTASVVPALQVDRDADGDVDQSDFGWFQTCLSGAFTPQSDPDCVNARLDSDTDVDADDLAVFQACLGQAAILASPACLPQTP